MRSRSKGEDSRNRLLEAAIVLFAERGYRETKISDIVKAAQLTQAAFYLYFPSKEAIFQMILERFHEKLRSGLRAAAERRSSASSEQDFPAAFQANIEAMLRIFAEDPRLTRIFLTEERNIDEVEKQIHQSITQDFLQHQSTGAIRCDISASMMANIMMGMLIQTVMRELLDNQREPGELAHAFTQILLFGISHLSLKGRQTQ